MEHGPTTAAGHGKLVRPYGWIDFKFKTGLLEFRTPIIASAGGSESTFSLTMGSMNDSSAVTSGVNILTSLNYANLCYTDGLSVCY